MNAIDCTRVTLFDELHQEKLQKKLAKTITKLALSVALGTLKRFENIGNYDDINEALEYHVSFQTLEDLNESLQQCAFSNPELTDFVHGFVQGAIDATRDKVEPIVEKLLADRFIVYYV